MNVCRNHGEEIAFGSSECPACDQIEEIRRELKEEHDEELGRLELENDELRGTIQDLKDGVEI